MQISSRRAIRKKVGEILIERKIITPAQLDQALQQQTQKGGYISQHLLSMGLASEEDIVRCLSIQYNMGYIPLDNYKIPKELLDVIPLKLIKIFSVVPLDKIDNVLTVAMADPLNEGAVEILREVTDCDVEVLISTYSEINRVIDRCFSEAIKEMGKYAITEDDLIKEGVVQSFVQTVAYSGNERRKYQRIDVDLDMEYFLYGKIFNVKIKNISYVGIYFISPSFIPVDTNILSKIEVKDGTVDVAVQIVRVEDRKKADRLEKGKSTGGYGIAGYFNFLTDDDKKKLIHFLENKINS